MVLKIIESNGDGPIDAAYDLCIRGGRYINIEVKRVIGRAHNKQQQQQQQRRTSINTTSNNVEMTGV
jgi:hypothetical protein